MSAPGGAQERPQAVLFACTHNAIRSPMAEAIARMLYGHDIYFASAGIRPGAPDPFVAAVLDEIGIEIGKHRPKTFDDLEDDNFDWIISLSPEAHHHALEYTRTMAVDARYWPTIDPSAVEGTREQKLEAYRATRDALMARIKGALGRQAAGSD